MKKQIKRAAVSAIISVGLLVGTMQGAMAANERGTQAYKDIVNNALTEANAAGLFYADAARGTLFDIDQNGTDELILLYTTKTEQIPFPFLYCSVYSLSGGHAVKLLDKEALYAQAGGPNGVVGVAKQNGQNLLYINSETGETGENAHRSGNWNFYQLKNNQLLKVRSVSYNYIDSGFGDLGHCTGSAVWDRRKISWQEYLSKISDLKPKIELMENGDGSTLEALLDQIDKIGNEKHLTDEQVAHIKQMLGVPNAMNVQVCVGNRYYWDAGARWLIQINLQHNDEMVAGAAFDADTLELCRNVMMYSGDTDIPSEWAAEEVDAAREYGLIPGELDKEYQTKITRAEFCILVWNLQQALLGEEPSELLYQQRADLLRDVFTDVGALDEYADQIASANRQGIVNGYGRGRFGPNDSINRVEAAAMLMRTARSLGMDEPTESQKYFVDTVALQQWAKDGINFISACAADGKAVMGGTGESIFSPESSYTREAAFVTFGRLYRCFENRKAVFCFDEAPIVTAALNYANGHYNQLAVYNQSVQAAAQDYVDKGLVYVNGMWNVLEAIKNLAQLDIEGYTSVVSKNDYNLIITQLMLSTDFYQGLTDMISANTMDKLNQIYAAICDENPQYSTLLGSVTNCKNIDELLNSRAYQALKYEINKNNPPLLKNLFSEVFGDVAGTVYNTVSASTATAADAIEAGAIMFAYQEASADFYQMLLQFRSYIRTYYAQDADIINLQAAIDELIQGYIKSNESDAFNQEFLSTFASGGAKKALNSLPGKFVEMIPQVAALQKVVGISFDVGMWINDKLFNTNETAYYGNLIPKIASVASIVEEFSYSCKRRLYDDRSAENASMYEQSARMYYNLIKLGHEAIIKYHDVRKIDSSEWVDSLNVLNHYHYPN
ncbi:MAG: S-layer homology domain-containing protein [Agathobaculum desmolans]|uniref:S-layer homology domain-containing protein n=1 Tax=Agathobaculum desmolans TaxID=39484 RepID=UPI003995B388